MVNKYVHDLNVLAEKLGEDGYNHNAVMLYNVSAVLLRQELKIKELQELMAQG